MTDTDLADLDERIYAARRALLAERQDRAKYDTLARADRMRRQWGSGQETDNQRLARLEQAVTELEDAKYRALFAATAGGRK